MMRSNLLYDRILDRKVIFSMENGRTLRRGPKETYIFTSEHTSIAYNLSGISKNDTDHFVKKKVLDQIKLVYSVTDRYVGQPDFFANRARARTRPECFVRTRIGGAPRLGPLYVPAEWKRAYGFVFKLMFQPR